MDKKQTTKDRLLAAACEIFSAKGFRDATVAEICEAADANIAAINYHFGDKEKLYEAVWRHAFEQASTAYPIDVNLPNESTLEDYLFSYANAMLHRVFSETESGWFAKLLYREKAAPTLALDHIANEVLLPQSRFLGQAILAAMGPGANEAELRCCMHSIIGQCAFYNFGRPLREKVLGKRALTEQEITDIARHIAKFSVGGIKEIRK